MEMRKTVQMLYGRSGLALGVPASAVVLEGRNPSAVPHVQAAVAEALANPIGSAPLSDLIKSKQAETAAITISDITRPVPNQLFLPALLETLNRCGIADENIAIIVGTGMHRPSTLEEHELLVGREILDRVEVVDHRADVSKTLTRISDKPPISICSKFAEADFRIVTGYIEPHFMAGFSGGRKGVCPALVDLGTVQKFHGYRTMADSNADTGNLKDNPCHEIALEIAKRVGVDFLFNVALTREREIAGIYCGEIESAHQVGCQDVAEWTTAHIDEPFDLVITNGGGFPLDQTFYQSVKGMCTALPALSEHSTLLQVSDCGEQIGSGAYADLMLRYRNDWQQFLADIQANENETLLDQWQYQLHTRVLKKIGLEKLLFASDGIPLETQKKLSVTPLEGAGDAPARVQHAINEYMALNPTARVAIIPEGPYTMLKQGVEQIPDADGFKHHTESPADPTKSRSSSTRSSASTGLRCRCGGTPQKRDNARKRSDCISERHCRGEC